MALVIACIIAFTQFEGTARWAVIGVGIAIEALEAAVMLWWSHRGRPAVGMDTLIGCDAIAVTGCRPQGRVRIGDETWDARCSAGCDPGTSVQVIAVQGMTLVVEPLS